MVPELSLDLGVGESLNLREGLISLLRPSPVLRLRHDQVPVAVDVGVGGAGEQARVVRLHRQGREPLAGGSRGGGGGRCGGAVVAEADAVHALVTGELERA